MFKLQLLHRSFFHRVGLIEITVQLDYMLCVNTVINIVVILVLGEIRVHVIATFGDAYALEEVSRIYIVELSSKTPTMTWVAHSRLRVKLFKACFWSPIRTYQVGVWYVNMVVA